MNKSLGIKYTSHDIQNELVEIMTQYVQREKIEEIRENVFFSIMGYDYANISNKEELSLCLHSVKENLRVQEDYLGFLRVTNIKHCVKSVQYGVFSGPYSVRMRENTNQKKLRIWTLFPQ